MIEIWKPIKDYENYEVSNLGKVKSLNYNRTGEEKILKPRKDKDGYLYVGLYKSGKRKFFKIHRLVATAYIFNPDDKPQINHIDCNRQNNCVENLEWCSLAYNTKHAYEHDLIKNYRGIEIIENGMQFKKIVDCINWLKNNGYPKARHSNIIMVIQGKRHIAYGHTYRYI